MKEKLSLIFLQGLGNSILNFPIYHQLQSKFEVDVLTYKNGSSDFYKAFGANVLQMNSVKDIVWKSLNHTSDIAVATYPSWRRELTALNLSRSREKIHLVCKNSLEPFFLGTSLNSNKERHDIENNWEILKHFRIKPDPSLNFSEILGLEKTETEKYAVIHPTASTVFKYYPKEFWIELIKYLETKFSKIFIVSTKSAEEMSFSQSILSSKCVHLPGLSFRDLSTIVAHCDQFVGLDSSIMHLAAMFNRKVLGLWSFADLRRIYPFTPEAQIYAPREVGLAQKFVYPKGKLYWLERADAKAVIKILDEELKADRSFSDQAANRIRIYYY